MDFRHLFWGRCLDGSLKRLWLAPYSRISSSVRLVHLTRNFWPDPRPMKTPSARAVAYATPKVWTIFFFFDGPNSSTVDFIADFPCFSCYDKTDCIWWKRLISASRCHPMCSCYAPISRWYTSVQNVKKAEKTPFFSAKAESRRLGVSMRRMHCLDGVNLFFSRYICFIKNRNKCRPHKYIRYLVRKLLSGCAGASTKHRKRWSTS